MGILKDERGISLVEVVASIILIGIILFSFFTLLLQSNKTTHKSNGIMDSTYAAQIEMEDLYTSSTTACTFEDITSRYTLLSTENTKYSNLQNVDKIYHFFPREDNEYHYYLAIETFFEGTTYENAIYIHLDAIDKRTNSKATMESVFELGGKGKTCVH